MESRESTLHSHAGVALLVVMGVVGAFLTALAFEALTDRDWTLSGWEWPEVVALALLLALGTLWVLSSVTSRDRMERTASRRARMAVPAPDVDVNEPRSSAATTQARSEDVVDAIGDSHEPTRRLTPGRVAGAAYRRLPRAPFRWVMPTLLWRGAFRFWLSVLAADPDPRRGVRDLLVSYDDTYRAVDQAAIRYDGGIHVKHRLTRYHDFFVERVNAGDRVLDLGSGKGELAFDLVTRAGATVVGVDHDPGHLAFAQERFSHPNLQFIEADVLVSIPEGHFDVVVLSNVLEHLDGRIEFLRGVVGSTTPDHLLFRVPVYERDWTVPLRDEVGLLAYWDSDHAIEYVPDTFIAELEDAGLEVGELFLRWGEIWSVARPRAAN